jgi:hypothetical protein
LRERVEQLGLEFFDVDLCWGVPAKDANGETANSWEYCRQWIDRAKPFFVGILGQRYGRQLAPRELCDPIEQLADFADIDEHGPPDAEEDRGIVWTTNAKAPHFHTSSRGITEELVSSIGFRSSYIFFPEHIFPTILNHPVSLL